MLIDFLAFLESSTGVIIMSIIWGLGLATIFHKQCRGSGCRIIKGPNPYMIPKEVYTHKSKCFRYQPEVSTCDNLSNMHNNLIPAETLRY